MMTLPTIRNKFINVLVSLRVYLWYDLNENVTEVSIELYIM